MPTQHEEKIEEIYQVVTQLHQESSQFFSEHKNLKAVVSEKKFKITDLYYDTTAAAEALCVSTRQVGRWIHDELVTIVRIGQRPMFEKAVLLQEVRDNRLIKRKRPCRCDD